MFDCFLLFCCCCCYKKKISLPLTHFPQKNNENSPIKRKNYLMSWNLILHFHSITLLFRKLCCMLLFVLEMQFLGIIYFSQNNICEPEFKISRNSPVHRRNRNIQITEKSLPIKGVFGQLSCMYFLVF